MKTGGAKLTTFDRIRLWDGMPASDPRNFPKLYTPQQRWIWDKATFTVPDDVPEERVQFAADKYRRKYGDILEGQGFEVLEMEQPHMDEGLVAQGTVDPNRRPYVIWARVRRRPVLTTIDAGDREVPAFEKAGFRLRE